MFGQRFSIYIGSVSEKKGRSLFQSEVLSSFGSNECQHPRLSTSCIQLYFFTTFRVTVLLCCSILRAAKACDVSSLIYAISWHTWDLIAVVFPMPLPAPGDGFKVKLKAGDWNNSSYMW